ncbi:Uu.00g055020.m01.CDS01 [Anthostomella pinea]|uniref:Uu.00g055020.m01.CDS01 n=1 Tax=Anthostomella pinea TaxID=933095 RepID=A0AAI8VWP6_9PEZI|nr:Uu.00g055020.m01.CDS01 [Anthostomella pinea]
MNISLPGIVDAAVPNRGNRNISIVSQNSSSSHNEQGFLSSDFPHSPPKIYITAESDDFDDLTLREWRDEGFNVEYLSQGNGGNEYTAKLASLGNGLGPCEPYGIVAYGDAASACLEHFHVLDNNPEFKLCSLVAYYPTRIPDPRAKFPSAIQVLAHLAGDDVGVVSHSQLVGIQGKRRVTKRKVEPGLGTGRSSNLAYPAYTYDAEPGFAEHDLDEYDKICAELAWSRSLTAVRRAFRRDADLEAVVEQNVDSKFYSRDIGKTMSTYTAHKSPHVTYFPTLTGGIGAQELRRFYSEFFINSSPPTMKLTLLSRTIGADRVVDELHVAFKHTQEMPWILPGVPPTNRRVEVMVVNIVTLRGGRVYHEHIYWDQASVLMQTGLLDQNLIPNKAKEKGVKSLPVVGKEAARRLLKGFDDEEDGQADNELIPEWYSDEESDEDGQNQVEDLKGKGVKEQSNGKQAEESRPQGRQSKTNGEQSKPGEPEKDQPSQNQTEKKTATQSNGQAADKKQPLNWKERDGAEKPKQEEPKKTQSQQQQPRGKETTAPPKEEKFEKASAEDEPEEDNSGQPEVTAPKKAQPPDAKANQTAELPKKEEPKKAEPKKEQPREAEPKKEEPKKEQPREAEPKKEEPDEAPSVDEHKKADTKPPAGKSLEKEGQADQKEEKVEQPKADAKQPAARSPDKDGQADQKEEKAEQPKADAKKPAGDSLDKEGQVGQKEKKVAQPKEKKVEESKEKKVEEPKDEEIEKPKEKKVEQPEEKKVKQPKEKKVEQPEKKKAEQPKADALEDSQSQHGAGSETTEQRKGQGSEDTQLEDRKE